VSYGFARINTDTAQALINVRPPGREGDCMDPPARKDRALQDDKAGGR
jgi:hypothetical protein